MTMLKVLFPILLVALLSGCRNEINIPHEPVPEQMPVAEEPTPPPAVKEAPLTQQELVEAALYGKTDVIQKGLEQGYEINALDPENRTLLMYAAFNGQTEIVKLLIKAGADVNAQDNVGTSPLMFAASAPKAVETVKVLLEAKAKINMVDNNEHFSALMWAAAEGQAENVKFLLAKGADLSLQDIDGDTAETFASKAGHTAVAQILKEAAANKKNPEEAEKKSE